MIRPSLLVGIGLGLALAACRPSSPAAPAAEDPYPAAGEYFGPVATDSGKALLTPIPPADAPAPQAGMASLSGALFSYTIGKIISETMFYLTPAQGENRDGMPPFLAGPDPARGDITGRSDLYGNFAFDGIPPGSYFLVVSAPYNWCPAEVAPDDQTARLIRLRAGDRLALGVVYVSWP
ncbi:MAG: hypothetical protein JW929_16515 [Anaerolineales bacterium]|nr:hypothetical protein [Anaerolineales bacterium]